MCAIQIYFVYVCLLQRCIQKQEFTIFGKCSILDARPGTVKHLCIAQGIYQDIYIVL